MVPFKYLLMVWINDYPLIWYIYSYDWYDWYSLYVNICINQLICFLYGLHVLSINRILPISNKILRKVDPYYLIIYSSFYSLFFYLLLVLFYNTLSAWCSNQLRTSESFFSLTTVLWVSQSGLFLILSPFTILPYILSLVIRIV